LETNCHELRREIDTTNYQNKKSIDKLEMDLSKEKTVREKVEKELENIKKEKDTLINNLEKEKTEKEN